MTSAVLAAGLIASAVHPYTRNVAIVVYDGVELLDFAGPAEVFAAAAGFGRVGEESAFRVYTVSATKKPITSQGFLQVLPDYSIDDAPPPDLIVLPGGNTGNVLSDPRFFAWAKASAEKAQLALSVCTGAFVLARAGLLDGRPATTWYNAVAKLRESTPKATVQEGRRFIDSGKIVTTAGVSAGIDGSLHVVARLLGRNVADRTARYMEYHWTPESYLAQGYVFLNPSTDEHGRQLQRGRIAEEEKDWPSAIRIYRAMVAENEKDAAAWRGLHLSLHGSGDFAGAIETGKRAAALGVDRPAVLVGLACSYARAGKREDALRTLERSLEAGLKEAWRLQDGDLDSLRAEDRFRRIEEAVKHPRA